MVSFLDRAVLPTPVTTRHRSHSRCCSLTTRCLLSSLVVVAESSSFFTLLHCCTRVCLKIVEGQSSNNPTNTDVPPTRHSSSSGETHGTKEKLETHDQPAEAESVRPNKRGLTSKAWIHFKRQKIDEKWKTICKYCDKKLLGETKQGTKHLHDHIRSCKLCTVRGPRQSILKKFPAAGIGTGSRGVLPAPLTSLHPPTYS